MATALSSNFDTLSILCGYDLSSNFHVLNFICGYYHLWVSTKKLKNSSYIDQLYLANVTALASVQSLHNHNYSKCPSFWT